MSVSFTTVYSHSAASLLANEICANLSPLEFKEKSKDEKATAIISRTKLNESAKALYTQMMRVSAKQLFDALGKNSRKKPMQHYSAAVKVLTVCSIYLIACENCRGSQPPQWLVDYLLEAMRFGDQLQMEPNSTEMICQFGPYQKSDLISGMVNAALCCISFHDESVHAALVYRIASSSKERYTLFAQAIQMAQQ